MELFKDLMGQSVSLLVSVLVGLAIFICFWRLGAQPQAHTRCHDDQTYIVVVDHSIGGRP